MDTLGRIGIFGGRLSLGRGLQVAVVVLVVGGAGVRAQGAVASPQDKAPAAGQSAPATPAPVTPQEETPQDDGGTPQNLQPEQPAGVMSKADESALLAEMGKTFEFVSKDTGLEIKHPIKGRFTSREDVNKMLRKKFDEDKSTKRMERDELVLKKFGLLDQSFEMRSFLLSLLTEQIAGFYDNKTKEMTLLDWVPADQQKPVMAHELTHALQDQRVGLTKWGDQEILAVAKDVGEDNQHIRIDETDTAREAVLEGQAMVSFADYMLRDTGRTLKDMPQVGDKLRDGAGDMSDSPVLARAPLLLQQALLFPYTTGLEFEQDILVKKGTARAFAGVLDHPPSSSFEIMHPDAYLAHAVVPVMIMPDIHPMLTEAGYEPYDIGVMGELDVRITAELFGGRPLAEALAPNWDGGIYYAAQRKNATAAEKNTTASLGLMYSSRWKNEDSAKSFFTVFEEELPRQYDGLKRRKKDEVDDTERVYSTREGDVLLTVADNRVFVSEGFDVALARKMRDAVDAVQGVGPVQQAGVQGTGSRGQGVGGELVGGLSTWMGGFGMVLPVR